MTLFMILVLLLGLGAGCSRHQVSTEAARSAPPVAVRVETLSLAEFSDVYEASGTVRARHSAAIASKIVATIREVRVHAGEQVRSGQVLATLDSRDLEAALRRAEAARLEVQNAIVESQNAVISARSALELAQVTHRRFQELFEKTSVSPQEFDESAARIRSAEAAVQMAVARSKQLQARLELVEAEVAAARVTLGNATLTAPFSGLITERRVDAGNLASPGVPLLVMQQEGSLRLEVSINESRLRLVRLGQPVQVALDGLDHTVTGRVAEIVPSVDAATRTFAVKIDLPAVSGLCAGMFGRAAFPAVQRRALLVPSSAVMERGQIQSVWVVDGDVARLRLVSLGLERAKKREVLAGVTAGEKIIVAPPLSLTEGDRVSVETEP